MKLWLSKNSEIPLREQLTRQIMLAISSEELQSGDKLPSVRELALRFKIHQNTVSTAYQWLEENGWVESRQGSGVFVKTLEKEKRETVITRNETELDVLISRFFRSAHRLGYSNSQIESGFQKYFENPKFERILIAEEDEYLQRIIFSELQGEIHFPMFGITHHEMAQSKMVKNSILIATPKHAERLQPFLPKSIPIYPLKINSVQAQMQGKTKPKPEELIGIVSGWERFLDWSKTFLIAAGLEADSIITRDVRKRNFRKGLESCLFVITDSVTARTLPKDFDVKIFQLIAQDSIEELKSLIS
ncbi:MAG TPA: GntR family transcriptional regulator [Pyrinomonadaceae bacterium]|nr:GntR family transcriptional regulator [Pyrinomonadaceae bacterium]